MQSVVFSSPLPSTPSPPFCLSSGFQTRSSHRGILGLARQSNAPVAVFYQQRRHCFEQLLRDKRLKQDAPRLFRGAGRFNLATSYFRGAYRPTIIGATAFHFRVRNGNGWDHCAMVTRRRFIIESVEMKRVSGDTLGNHVPWQLYTGKRNKND